MPEFYIIIARKFFSPNFRGGGHVPPSPAPVSYAYVNMPLLSVKFMNSQRVNHKSRYTELSTAVINDC